MTDLGKASFPEQCGACPGQHRVVLEFTVCSPCNSSLGVAEAMALAMKDHPISGNITFQSVATGLIVRTAWAVKHVDVVEFP